MLLHVSNVSMSLKEKSTIASVHSGDYPHPLFLGSKQVRYLKISAGNRPWRRLPLVQRQINLVLAIGHRLQGFIISQLLTARGQALNHLGFLQNISTKLTRNL
jgi:hypothetical protein